MADTSSSTRLYNRIRTASTWDEDEVEAAYAAAKSAGGAAPAQTSEPSLPSPHQQRQRPVQQLVNLIDLEEEDQGKGSGDGQPVTSLQQPHSNNLGHSPAASSSSSHQHRELPDDPFMELASRSPVAHGSLGKHASAGDVPGSLLGRNGVTDSEPGPRSNSFGVDSSPSQTGEAASVSGRDAAGGAVAAAPAGAPPWHSWFTGRRGSKHHHTPSAPPQPASSEAVDDTDVFGLLSRPKPSQAPASRLQHAATGGTAEAAGGAGSQQGQSQSQQPEQEERSEQEVDFTEVDGSAAGSRELTLYAVPLYKPEPGQNPVECLVFLPVTLFQEQEEHTGIAGMIKGKVDSLKASASAQWAELKEKERGTIGHSVYKVGNRVVNDLTPEERMTRNIPKHVSKVIIYHPTQVPPDTIMEKLSSMTSKHQILSSAKAAFAGLMLPVAFGIDILIIPGPQVLTYYTSFLLYKNTSSAIGTSRLTKYIRQEGSARDVRVCYAGDVRLDPFFEALTGAPDPALDEDNIEALCRSLGEKELLEPLLELRARRLRDSAVTRGSGSEKYHLLPTDVS